MHELDVDVGADRLFGAEIRFIDTRDPLTERDVRVELGRGFALGPDVVSRLEMIAATTPQSAERYRAAYGFARATADWRELVNDPLIDAVVIAAPAVDHAWLARRALLRAGVIVRPVAGYGMPNFLRVSIGLPTENARFLEALAKVLGA